MSYCVYLVAMEKKLAVDLGKIATLDENGFPVEAHFTGWIDQETAERVQGEALLRCVAHFCAWAAPGKLELLQEEDFDGIFVEQAGWRILGTRREVLALGIDD